MQYLSAEYADHGGFLPLADKTADTYRYVFDAVNDGIFIAEPHTGRFTEINQPGWRMFGYDKADLLGCTMGTLSSGIHPYTFETAADKHRKLRLDEHRMFEWQCKTSNGVLFWTEVSLRYTELDDTPAVVAVVRDITKRKRLSAELVRMAHHDALTGLSNRFMFTAALKKANLALARAFGSDAIADGVETREQLTALRGWGCAHIQGYAFSRLISPEAILLLLSAGTIKPTHIHPTR